MENLANLIGSAGVALLLMSFLLNLQGWLKTDGYGYPALNLVGAALACYSSYLIDFVPFIVLEGVWALVALLAVYRKCCGFSRREAV